MSLLATQTKRQTAQRKEEETEPHNWMLSGLLVASALQLALVVYITLAYARRRTS